MAAKTVKFVEAPQVFTIPSHLVTQTDFNTKRRAEKKMDLAAAKELVDKTMAEIEFQDELEKIAIREKNTVEAAGNAKIWFIVGK